VNARRPTRAAALGAGALLAALAAPPAAAQEFGLYLLCKGKVVHQGRSTDAHLDLALRRNSQLALIQRSNVLPVGERLKLETSPAHYSMVFRAPLRGSAVWVDWVRGAVFVWAPELQKLHTTRLSVDRQSAKLEGEMVDAGGQDLGRLDMVCDPKTNETIAEPKF
jgi:hypothetical protein